MDKKLIEELKQKLEEQKKSIQKELESFAKKDDVPKGDWETRYPNRENGNMEEEADEVQEYGNMLPVEHSLELKLKDVNSALEKIEKGGCYGICENCGKEIDEQRLLACPEAKTCLKCNEK
jgi:RNA polymerase-binding transcription factor DksA